MVEIPTYQIGIFVFDLTFSIEKKCAKTRPKTPPYYTDHTTLASRRQIPPISHWRVLRGTNLESVPNLSPGTELRRFPAGLSTVKMF